MSRTRTEIEAEVEEIAIELVDEDTSIEAARAMVWEEVPELYAEYRAAPIEVPVVQIAKEQHEPTLGEEIHRVVQKRAAQMAWTQWPTKSLEDLEWEVWTTPEGEALWSLYTSPEARQPMSQVHVHKSAAHQDAWSILQAWGAE